LTKLLIHRIQYSPSLQPEGCFLLHSNPIYLRRKGAHPIRLRGHPFQLSLNDHIFNLCIRFAWLFRHFDSLMRFDGLRLSLS
jgi:hypothetical protein